VTTDEAILELREDLREIAAVDGCTACECLMAVAAQALVDVRRIPGDEARSAEDDLRAILDGGRQSAESRAGCDPCLPVEPYMKFRAALPERLAPDGPAGLGGCAGCDCDGCGG
jgi:hypothetical protein